MPGFDNSVVYADNVDFSGGSPVTGKVTTDGQLLIGSTAAPNIRVGNITAGNGVDIVNGSGTIQISASSSLSSGFYGDGSDGNITFDGVTTVLSLVPVANTYTLTRDLFLGSSTIDSGVSLITNGFRIFCNDTLTNNGTIKYNGNNGTSAGVAGIALNNGSNSSISNGVSTNSFGTAGGAGNAVAGSAGVNVGSGAFSFGGSGGNGGAGANAGGNAGTLRAVDPNKGSIRALPFAVTGILMSGDLGLYRINAASGGGGGGGDGVNNGGGGGSGAGVIILSCLYFAGTGIIQALGGNGGDGNAAGTNCGGGGGGGGGVIIIISRSISAGAIAGQTISVTGGTGGAGTGTGATGSNGNVGTTILLPN